MSELLAAAERRRYALLQAAATLHMDAMSLISRTIPEPTMEVIAMTAVTIAETLLKEIEEREV